MILTSNRQILSPSLMHPQLLIKVLEMAISPEWPLQSCVCTDARLKPSKHLIRRRDHQSPSRTNKYKGTDSLYCFGSTYYMYAFRQQIALTTIKNMRGICVLHFIMTGTHNSHNFQLVWKLEKDLYFCFWKQSTRSRDFWKGDSLLG